MAEENTLTGTRIPDTGRGLCRAVLVVILLGLIVYWPVTRYGFISLDDNLYVVENPEVRKGLSAGGVAWAMTTLYAANWHPLTWLSLLTDYELFGFTAAGFHTTNLLLHILNALLLFFFLSRITGETGRSLAVAALFMVHPLNIESVAWIAERKNLLSTLFWILTLGAYIRYAKRGEPVWYFVTLFVFGMGLTAKSMLVTLPAILLLLDYWPLGRFSPQVTSRQDARLCSKAKRTSLKGLLVEKIPFFLLALCSCAITLYAANAGGALKSIDAFPLSVRIQNAVVSLVSYLGKMIWPADLAIFYPYPANRPWWQFAGALLVLGATSATVIFNRRRHPYALAGWLWYLVALTPVIGIVQVGFQAMANRYAYVPLIGVFIAIVWTGPELVKNRVSGRCLPVAAVVTVLLLSLATWMQLPNWRNSEAAFRHALSVTGDNFIAHLGLGAVRLDQGDLSGAGFHFRECLRLKPDSEKAHNNLAVVLFREGRREEAADELRKALVCGPEPFEAHFNLRSLLALQGQRGEAEVHLNRAPELNPGSVRGDPEARIADDF